MGYRVQTLATAGGDVHYYMGGRVDGETVVLIHAAFGDHSMFAHQEAALGERYRLLLLDMPGHGASQMHGGAVTLGNTSALLAEIMDREGIDRAHVVGVSLGSLMAQDLAVRFPERVHSITVVGGYSVYGDHGGIQKAQRGEMIRWVFMMAFSMERFRRYVSSGTNIVPEEREAFYRATQGYTRGSFRLMGGMSQVLRAQDAVHTHPLLIMAGDQDLPLVRAYFEDWCPREPLAECFVVPDAGHCANMDNPAAFNARLLAFLEKQSGGR
jgi:3-oxoadipate enol-lactonase